MTQPSAGMPKIRWEWTWLFVLLAYPFLPFLQAIEGIPLGTPIVSILIFAILALGLNVVVGYSGLLQLGIAAFFAIGAYITGILTVPDYPFQAGFWIALPLSVIGAGVAGVILGAPTLRLRGDYLAIVTLGFAEVIRYSLINLDEITNSNRALNPVPPPSLSWLSALPGGLIRVGLAAAALAGLAAACLVLWKRMGEFRKHLDTVRSSPEIRGWLRFAHYYLGPAAVIGAVGWAFVAVITAESVAIQPEWGSDYRWFYYLIFAILAALVVVLRNLERSRLGRALMAIREDELAASCMGVNPTRVKLVAFALGAAIAGLAGSLYATFQQSTASPNNYDFAVSIMALCFLIVGGLGNCYGAILGAFIILGVDRIFSPWMDKQVQKVLSDSQSVFLSFSNWRWMIFGAILVLMMRFRPEGALPARPAEPGEGKRA